MASSSSTATRPDRSADPDYLGPAVVDGVVRYFSPSQLQKGDPESPTGCQRAWYYNKVLRMPEPTTKAQAIGIAGHKEVEDYLETGVKALSRRVISGLSAFPPPRSEMLIELPLVPRGPDGKYDFLQAPLRAAGIPVFGKIDMIHQLGINYGAPGGAARDPDGTTEVCDWKFSKNLDHAYKGRDLAGTIQMSGYGKFALQVLPDTRYVRLSHGYFPLKGEFEKRTHLFEPDEILLGWERAERVGGCLIEAAQATSADQVPGNPRACKAFGKECTYAPICSIKKHKTLAACVGITAADRHLKNLGRNRTGDPVKMTATQTTATSPGKSALMAKLAAAKAGKTVTAAAPVAPAAPTPAAGPTAEEIALEKARLEVTRANLKYSGLLKCWNMILAYDQGVPVLVEEAAAAIAAITGQPVPEPSGLLAEFALSSVDQVVDTLTKLSEWRAESSGVAADPDAVPADGAVDIVSPETPVIERNASAVPPPATEPAKPDAAAAAITAVGEKRRAGRPAGSRNKTKPEPVAPPTQDAPTPSPVTASAAPAAPAPARDGKINVFINCTPSITCTSLWPLFHEIVREMTELAGVADFRITEPTKEDKFSFGRWPGVLTAFVRSPDAGIEPGNYSLIGAGGGVALEFAAAIRQIAHESGGLVVVGS